MLESVDRIQLTTHNAATTAEQWARVLDAAQVGEDHLDVLNAHRVTLQIGDSLTELLEPTGTGLVQTHLDTGRGGLFSIGVTTRDPDALYGRLSAQGIEGLSFGEQRLFTEAALGIPGLTVLVSVHEHRESVGLVDTLYEATHLTPNGNAATAIADVFGLDASQFVPIESGNYGYRGHLTLFDSARLDRVETIFPFDADKTMGRYFHRFGPSLYMCYAEAESIVPLRERLMEVAPGDWTGSTEDNDGLFVHPKALGGVMMGVSRVTHAWTWSGYPERRLPPAAHT
ncbi:MAG: hypothetical protein QF921_07145 [Pseudomonadales bacterium]|jgi:hypothetical protein|nr:hypothetical protein [Pseudomonadales bacterium]MDP6469806.1 hypothetical protein [Pseudomonadales bacterium]MDP6827592.1 hypothetical protein [Pseudomonadales bacterium]MDP6971276.1 hypothetical protein [Pseudomonadales bacterium]|tara:strand:- start:231 stop:1085 length:855 start_codon:yes stop_codon:yes gene_type:complete